MFAEQLSSGRDLLQSLNEKFDTAVRDLKVTCRAKSAVPVDQVYVRG